MSKKPPKLSRLLIMLPAGLALLGGLNGALMLLDLPAPLELTRLRDGHGIILVIGFVGTLIAVERAVALRKLWGYLSPLLLGAGALLVMSPAPTTLGRSMLVAGAALMVAVYIPLWRRHEDATVLVQLMGAVLLTAAATLWLRDVAPSVFLPWLAGFVILTVGAERIELARIANFDAEARQRADSLLLLFSHLLVAGTVAAVLWPVLATPVLGIIVLSFVLWLLQTDIARSLVKADGAPRYMAICLLFGHAWLGVAGLTWIMAGAVASGPAYDAVIHAIFLGFTITMIMAHSPVILPAVLRRPLPYRPYMYGPMLLLQFGLVLRILIGDAFDIAEVHRIGGLLNIIALLAFVAGSFWSAATAGSRSRSRRPAPTTPTTLAEPSESSGVTP